MPDAFPRCEARLRNGQPCGRTVVAGSAFCTHHAKLLETVDAGSLREGRIPKRRALTEPKLRIVSEVRVESEPAGTTVAHADPATIRPLLAAAAADNVEALTESLLAAAGSAVTSAWITVECSSCGERSRVEAPVPDVRARVAAIELLLREGLGRPAVSESQQSPRLPEDVNAVAGMSWDDTQHLATVLFADEIESVLSQGGREAVRERLAEFSVEQRRVLSEALAELAPT
jgi:hypothetical protein